LILLDVSMPDMDGWAVARLLRKSKRERPAIIMLSAITMEKEREFEPDRVYDDYMIKPLDLRQLLEKFHTLLDIKWTTGAERDTPPPPTVAAPPVTAPPAGKGPPLGEIDALIHLGQIGHVSGINAKLAEIEANSPEHGAFVKDLRVIVKSFNLNRFLTVLEAQRSHHAP
jgi:hypothetical protein